MNKKKRTQFW